MQVARNSKKIVCTFNLGRLVTKFNSRFSANLLLNSTNRVANGQSLVYETQRNFSQKIHLEKISSFENLNYRISNAVSLDDILNIYEQNAIVFKNENIVHCLRTLSRIAKGSSQSQIETLPRDKRYKKMTEDIWSNLDRFNAHEIMHILFWMRRFRSMRISLCISEDKVDSLFQKAFAFLKSGSYQFRDVVHLFYHTAFLNRSTDDISSEILKQLRKHDDDLNPTLALEILQACAREEKYLFAKEFLIIEHIIKQLPSFLKETNNEQNCHFFKYISALELHLNPPRFRIPPVLYNLKTLIKENLNQLSENEILSVTEAFIYLPRDFHADLLEEIKGKLAVTIQHHGTNIKSYLLLEFLDKITQITQHRKFSYEKLHLAFDEIAKRLPDDNYLSKFRNLEKIIELYDKTGVRNPTLVQKVYDTCLATPGVFFSGPILQSFTQHNLSIKPFLDKFFASEYYNKMSDSQAMRVFIVISGFKGDKHLEIKEKLKSQLLASKEDLSKFIALIADSEILNKEIYGLLDAMVDRLKTSADLSDSSFYKGMLQSVVSIESRKNWGKWAREHLRNLDHSQLSKLTDVVFALDDLSLNQIQLYAHILMINKPENIPLKKVLLNLKDHRTFIYEFATKAEINFENFVYHLMACMEAKQNDARLATVYGVVKRIETTGVLIPVASYLVGKAYSISRKHALPNSLSTEVVITLYLIDHNILKKEDAKDIFKKCKENMNDIIIHSKYFTYILQKASKEELANPTTIEEGNEILEQLQRQLSETNTRTVLAALAAILTFPPQFWRVKKDFLAKTIKEFIGVGNAQTFLDIINAFPQRFVKSEPEIYLPFFKEITASYPQFKKKLSANEIVSILERMSSLNYTNANIYNLLLTDIGKHFNSFKKEDYFELLAAFCKIGIKQSDLFDRILTKVEANPFSFSRNIKFFLLNLAKVGHRSEHAKEMFMSILNKYQPTRVQEVLAFVCYIPILKLEKAQEKELLEKYISDLEPKEVSFSVQHLLVLYDYLRFKHADKPHLHEKIKSLISNFPKTYQQYHSGSGARTKAKKLIGGYLKVMNIEFREDFSIEDYHIDLYIPSTNNIIKIFMGGEVCFDRFGLAGKSIVTEAIYKSFKGYKPIFINLAEFKNIGSHLNKVNHLTAKGIENNNIKGVYDFSQIGSLETHVEDEKEEENLAEENPKFVDEERVKENLQHENDEDL